MANPALVGGYDDPGMLAGLEQALARRFGTDYEVLGADTPAAALEALGRLSQAGEQVALLLADQSLEGMTGVELLCQAHALHPTAKRVLLITYGDAAAGVAALQAMALGQFDDWLNTPFGSPLELVRVVGSRWSARSHELRDLLGRNNIPHGFYDADSQDGRQLLARAGLEAGRLPVLLLFDGQVLVDPPNEQLAQPLGARTRPAASRYDVAVVGAGPAGLAAATYAASEGLA